MTPETIVFSSWHGRFADSPRALFEGLRRRSAGLRHVWVLDPAADVALPPGVRRVAPDSPEELAELEAARYIVSNDVLQMAFDKRPDATYLQTWHGTPLKRIAYDVVAPRFDDAEHHYAVELGRDIARWDALLSPNRFSTPVLRRAFRFGGTMLETGYPRNDVLSSPERDAVRRRVRDALGLPASTRAVLYAPTWRDDDRMPTGLALDLEEVRAAFGEDVVVLARTHWLVALTAGLADGPALRNVTAWPDISELYLAADVLLTDYSSAMVDFAVTGRPILLFTYDLERYRDELRGFYLDLEAEAPGPMLRTTAEVVEALADLDAVAGRHAGAYGRFAARLCHLDDGHATDRVLDALLDRGASPVRHTRVTDP